MFEIKKATKKKIKLKLFVAGPSGSGKTYSSLKLAHGIESDWEKIFFIDTENESASYYADLGPFNHVSFEPPYTPERYIEAINACIHAGATVICIDSISHVWEGKGGCLDIHQKVVDTQKYGNSFTAWAKVTPRYNSMVDHIRNASVHIIACGRTKQDYVIEEKNGKSAPKKVGLKVVSRDGTEYEYSVMFSIDMDHHAFAEKDRTGLFMDKPKHIITEDTGKKLLEWANSGKEENYSGLDSHKRALMEIAKNEGISEPEDLKKISEMCMGIPMSQLNNKIISYKELNL